MPEVFKIIAEVEKPSSKNPAGKVTIGFYTVTDGVLTMTDASGVPTRRDDGDLYTHKLGPGENPRAMACVLCKQVRAAVQGYSLVSGPAREPIAYSKTGWR